MEESNFLSKIESSKNIVEKAILDYKPYAIVLMLSGGDDSLAALAAADYLGIKIDFILHGNTRTGIKETTDFARNVASQFDAKYIEADAGNDYEKYVLRKGFFGRGITAHSYAYHVLKIGHFRKAVSKHIRQGKRGRTILFLNGARKNESENRKKHLKIYQKDPSQPKNIWVNIIHYWEDVDKWNMLDLARLDRNPVSKKLCRSGECMCGTTQSMEQGLEAAYWFPDWGEWWKGLRKEVMKKFPWDWSENINKYHYMEMNGQGNLFQPMCHGCEKSFKNGN
jgi:3'-phosphoadenosine 5'-phosphosulfate sulfotransferase (PAPS reductase)/FAD synthetase